MLGPTLLLIASLAQADSALHFDGVDDHVAMGEASSLGLEQFTLECWFRFDGDAADTAGSGSGGVSFYPLVPKGRGESDGSNVDMNYGLGVEATTGTLTADFEDYADGSNHPVTGSTDVRDGLWHHAAVSYDGSGWTLFLDGSIDAESSAAGAVPRYDSIQHLAVGTAMNSSGEADGRFRGAIDEVRIWSRALTLSELQSGMNRTLRSGTGLVARWGFDEGSGETAAESVGGVDGDVVGAAWTAPAPFDASLPPDAPVLIAPADGASDQPTAVTLQVEASDPEGDALIATFYGRPLQVPEDDFALVVLPDTQYYCSQRYEGAPEMFYAQTEWIVEQRELLNIQWVAHVGDLVDTASDGAQWLVADEALSALEDPLTTGLEDGIPYGVAPGNHDQDPSGDPDGSTELFNQYFGVDRFEERAYYGGNFDENNDDHWGTFSVGALDFLVIDIEYDQGGEDVEVLLWADELIGDHPDHRVIVNAHHLIESSGVLSDQGQIVYEALGHHDNLFLMLSGHLTDEVWRSDPAGETGTVYTVMADYQFDGDGGAGWLRVMEFSPAAGHIHVWTWSPWLEQFQDDDASDFELPYTMDPVPFEEIGSVEVEAGEASIVWRGLDEHTAYEWYVVLDDGGRETRGETWGFTTGDIPGDTDTPDDTGDTPPDPRGVDEGCGCSGGAGGAGLLLGLMGLATTRRRRASRR